MSGSAVPQVATATASRRRPRCAWSTARTSISPSGAAAARAAFLDPGRPLLNTVIEERLRPWAAGLAAGWPEASVGALRAVAPLVVSDPTPAGFIRRVAALSVEPALYPGTVTAEVLRCLHFDAAPATAGDHPGTDDPRREGQR